MFFKINEFIITFKHSNISINLVFYTNIIWDKNVIVISIFSILISQPMTDLCCISCSSKHNRRFCNTVQSTAINKRPRRDHLPCTAYTSGTTWQRQPVGSSQYIPHFQNNISRNEFFKQIEATSKVKNGESNALPSWLLINRRVSSIFLPLKLW